MRGERHAPEVHLGGLPEGSQYGGGFAAVEAQALTVEERRALRVKRKASQAMRHPQAVAGPQMPALLASPRPLPAGNAEGGRGNVTWGSVDSLPLSQLKASGDVIRNSASHVSPPARARFQAFLARHLPHHVRDTDDSLAQCKSDADVDVLLAYLARMNGVPKTGGPTPAARGVPSDDIL
eukprot:TRINITY_DN30872_c0_g1_i1.p1 TRINITY_DN30872_c0_g1~~TRINITY_DN30872_c0_g1_i1.p1  ORF type:complete len:180 (+),score=10.51 TRINITY_DN30872_c0_g1_i1:72-611(+)